MVRVIFEFKKKDFVWIVPLVLILVVGVVYAVGADPVVHGHQNVTGPVYNKQIYLGDGDGSVTMWTKQPEGRFIIAPYDDGDWQWNREFGYRSSDNTWYIEGDLEVGGTISGGGSGGFGTWTTKDSAGNTMVRRVKYKVPSDGFVFGKDGADGHLQIYIYAADCSTVLVSYYGNQHGAGHVGSLPIPKDTCFEFDPTSADTDVIYWMPVGGTGSPIKQ